MAKGDLSIVLNEKINLKLLKDNPDYLLKHDQNYFLSEIGKDIFEVYKNVYFDKQMELSNQNIILYGNGQNDLITDQLLETIDSHHYDVTKFSKYFDKLKQDFIKDKTNNYLLKNILIQVNSKDDLDVENLEKLTMELQNNISILKGKEKLFKNPEQMIIAYEEEIKQRFDGKVYSIGCSYLDKYMLLGARPGLITTIFAHTGVAKSAFALSLDNKRINKNIPSLHISLENDNFLTSERLVSMRIQKDIRQYYNLEENNFEQFKQVIGYERKRLMKSKKYYFVEESGLSLIDIENLIIEAKKMMGTDYIIVTIDLAGMIKDFGKDAREIEESMDKVQYMLKRQNAHGILIFQANRETVNTKVKTIDDIEKLRPGLTNIKNSGSIEAASRVVLGLFRKMHYIRQYFPEDPRVEIEDDILECMILKQNAGALKNLKYVYFPTHTSFIPLKDQ